MDEVKSRKDVIKSNIETKDEKVVRKKSYADKVIHVNKKGNTVRT